MNEVDALSLGKIDDAWNIEVSGDRPAPFTDEIGFISLKTVNTEAVFISINPDSTVTEFGGGSEDANSDFATIGG